jgi:hypothetical protein
MVESPGLASLLSALREAGIVIGVTELARLRQIFALAPRVADTEPKQKLKSLLRSVLVKSTEEVATFERVCEAWLAQAEILALPEHADIQDRPARTSPQPDKLPIRRYFLAALIILSLAMVAGAVYFLDLSVKSVPAPPPTPPQEKPAPAPPPAPPQEKPVEPPQEPTLDELYKRTFKSRKPALTVIPPQIHWTGWWELGLGISTWLAAMGLWLALKRRRWLPEPEPLPTPKGAPRILLQGEPVGPVLLDPEQQEALVWGIGHFEAEALTRKLDIPATVRATARAAGIPTLEFHSARYQREVWLWLDEAAADANLARLAEEIEGLLSAHGLAVERATFWGVPWFLSTAHGQVFAPKEVEERREVALVAVLTDGRLLARQYEADDRRVRIDALLRGLSHWPHLWFVDATAGAAGLKAILARHALACIHPNELAARISGAAAVRPLQAVQPGDGHVWAAACALAPAPVDENTALALRYHLKLRSSPWALRTMLAQSSGPSERLLWPQGQRAELVNWLAGTEVQGQAGQQASLLERALNFWEQRYGEAARKREEAQRTAWIDTPAARHLRMEIAVLNLWREPSRAIRELYRLFQGALKEPIQQQLQALASKDQGGEAQIRLPWHWEERSGPEQHMLLAMGFAGKALSAIRLQRPGRSWLGLGLGVGLATGALAVAALRPFVPATGAPTVVHGEDKPESVAERITPLTQGQYRITVATPKWLEQTTAPAGAQVKVTWPLIDQPCVDQAKGAEIWRCAGVSAPGRLSLELIRSLAVLVAPPTEATPLALALLNSGTGGCRPH